MTRRGQQGQDALVDWCTLAVECLCGLRGGQWTARAGAGREALLWPEPLEWDAECDFTACYSGGKRLRRRNGMLNGLSVGSVLEYSGLRASADAKKSSAGTCCELQRVAALEFCEVSYCNQGHTS